MGTGGLLTGVKFNVEGTILPNGGRNTAIVAFDSYIPHPGVNPNITDSGPYQFGFLTGDPLSGYAAGNQYIEVTGPSEDSITGTPFKVAGYYFNAGNGGNSESGPGGAGGTLGQSLTVTGSGETATATGTLSVEFPTNLDYEGLLYFNAGNGGNGFNAGGAGGNLVGISVTYPVLTETSEAFLTAGAGGQSLTGAGGAGGSESQLYINTGLVFQGGNGGIGVVGGSGGSLLGNTTPGLITSSGNNLNDFIKLQAGNGADGILGGGNGGNITSFVNEFLALTNGNGGALYYVAGNAGNAVAGQAGTGGSIINSSPDSYNNNLVGDIILLAGNGGSGLDGGGGGSITNFEQLSTVSEIPTSFTIIAGFGGDATIGTGGAGGGISGIAVSASGTGSGIDYFGTPYVYVQYNRQVAGAGGTSAGGVGGAGGSISDSNTASVASTAQNVLAAGAGGAGLTAGGAGGSVTSVIAEAGSTSGKVVVIAGDGGASAGAEPLPSTSKTTPAEAASNIVYAIGGVDGPGGLGGSIDGFTELVSVETHVDLIAGNGGDTLNHSVMAGNATKDNSGAGGSISNVSVLGSIGNCATNVAIKSYNDLFAGQTMQEFVDSYILGNIEGIMTDAVGNVGLVAGAAGRVVAATTLLDGATGPDSGTTAPSTDGINGSVTNIHAENIMSMVAGNVDQVSIIRKLTDYGVTITDGILGANKNIFYNPVTTTDDTIVDGTTLALGDLNYIYPDGALRNTPLPGGDALIDGAFLAQNIRKIQSPRDFQGTVPS